jgi:type III secretion system YscQ/HrcQ family protein
MKEARPFPFAELPRVSRAQVEAGRRLLALLPLAPGPDWAEACRALGGPVEITLIGVSVLSASELMAEARGTQVRLDAGGARQALLVLDPALAPRLARRALGTDARPELPAPRPLTLAEEGAIEFLVGAMVQRGSICVRGVVKAGERALPIGAEAWVWVLAARIETPVGGGWARLYAPASVRHAAPVTSAEHVDPAEQARLERARVEVRIEVGHAPLTVAELEALGPGDIVRLDEPALRGQLARLRIGRGGFGAHLDGEALVIEEPFRRETRMSDPRERSDVGELVRELPVEVACELGRVTMSGRELLDLRPGAVVPVGRPLAGPVDLTVGGRVVARGELVDIEGEVGVRVTQRVA